MSANNKTDKINKTSECIRLLLVILIAFSAVLLIACHKEETPRYSVIVLDEKDNVNVLNEDIVVNIPETNNTPDLSVNTIISDNSEEQETIANETINEPEQEPKQEQEQTSERTNAVDFYFLLKGKSYFRYFLYEGQLQAFNMSNTIIRITPIFIANDSVIFRVDDYTTGAVKEKEWFTTPGFEIYISDIYFRR